MNAKDIMNHSIVTVTPETPVRDAAQLLLDNRISGLPVVDAAGKVVGIVSEGDFLRRVAEAEDHHRSWWLRVLCDPAAEADSYVKAHGRVVGDVMSSEVVTVGEDVPVAEIAHLLETKKIKRVPVVRDGKLVGIVSRADLLRSLAARRTPETAAGAASPDDAALRTAVLDVLRETDWAPTANLNVLVSAGVVSFWGFIDNPSQERALRVAAEGVPGVKGVEMNVSMLPYVGIV